MAVENIRAVQLYRELVEELLDAAAEVKQSSAIDPPITEADLGDAIRETRDNEAEILKNQSLQSTYAAVETAFREKFYHLLATTSITEPEFVQIWNLLDIVSFFSDNGKIFPKISAISFSLMSCFLERCEPGLIFWLIEELLDSQTIDGCRKVFDYLESRRERNTAVSLAGPFDLERRHFLILEQKHFKQKSLIILRSCNELLRRLSRAEDTVFCGRVFIFLFQSFPLGDKSSVNLRGEYHTENVTAFDELPKPAPTSESAMDVDMHDVEAPKPLNGSLIAESAANSQAGSAPVQGDDQISKRPSGTVAQAEDTSIDMDALYPVFWGLQANFSAPTRLFEPEHFASFKTGLESTVSTFRKVSMDLEKRGMTKGSEETPRRGIKRKRTENGAETANTFNPKYLTSRDLFELEANDVAFRRHILVQSLIILDFLISLTPRAKAKLTDTTNKSVLYSYVLNDEDVSFVSTRQISSVLLTTFEAKWVAQMKSSIASYLQQGNDGKFYYRMVDTVLTRDKNWVRWKAEGCPPIERPPVQVEDYLNTQSSVVKISTSKRLRAAPLGSLDLRFLSEDANLGNLNCLKETERYVNPRADTYMKGIADDEFNIEMAQTSEEKEEAARAKASKTWRILRISLRNKLNRFDHIDDGKKLKYLFESPPNSEKPTTETENGVDSHGDGSAKNESLKENNVLEK
ncbi:hypothetical protein PRK78_004846 [Emydomyces testavorans]|uniref:Nuclear matrix protein n=1 Tax=Emydomyces testavorans TaxID=2070801 RepID=A0AAF0DM94_9EURO|nr:hypothetical protein PRK78_004846 [Emydomyces testavorans]